MGWDRLNVESVVLVTIAKVESRVPLVTNEVEVFRIEYEYSYGDDGLKTQTTEQADLRNVDHGREDCWFRD